MGHNRSEAATKSLALVEKDLQTAINNSKDIVIKPNLVQPSCPEACTSSSILRALIDSYPEIAEKRVKIAEGSSVGTTSEGFKSMGYTKLSREYGFELVDVNHDESKYIAIYDATRRKMEVRASITLLESDLRISVCPAKTHDTVLLTLSIKNCCVGALVGDDKKLVHQGYPMINLNLSILARELFPHFSIVDAYTPMEGDGPTDGNCTKRGIVLAGKDSLAVDSSASRLLGFEPEKIGYLVYCDLLDLGMMREDMIDLTGLEKPITLAPLIPHHSFRKQLAWKFDDDFAFRALGIRE